MRTAQYSVTSAAYAVADAPDVKTVVLVDDHTFIRQTLARTLMSDGRYTVVGEAGDGEEALLCVERTRPDIAVLDVGLPGEDGLSIGTRIRRASPSTRIVFLTMHDDEATIRGAISIGADGFIPKLAGFDELITALTVVSTGQTYLSPLIAGRVMRFADDRLRPSADQLSDRELEILRLMSRGMRTAEMASQLFVSIKTVKNHLTKVYSKLGVTSGAQAVAKAYEQSLVTHSSSPYLSVPQA